MFVESTDGNAFDFDYMNVVEENGRETINRREHDQMVESFTVSAKSQHQVHVPGYCLSLISFKLPPAEIVDVETLSANMRQAASLPTMVASRPHYVINGQSECLGAVDQLVIGTPDLADAPDTCEAIRFWIERGGRALLLLNLMGEESTRAILGDTCPFSVIDETTPLTMQMDHRWQSSGVRQQADLSYQRTMQEPVSMTRAIFDSGSAIWSSDGWPVLLKVPMGNGTVFISTVSPRVLLDEASDNRLAVAATVVVDELFRGQQQPPLLEESVLAEAAHARIGYSIPSRTFPIVVLSLFVVVLGILGWWLFKSERQGWLTVAAPAVAVLAAIPGLAMGLANRTAVPPTLLETRVVYAPAGQSALVADGVTTIYQPESAEIDLMMSDSAVVIPQKEAGAAAKGRHVWDRPDGYTWKNFSQPAGVTDYRQRSVVRLPKPLSANASLDADGLQVQLSNAEFLQPEDAIIASLSPERMAARPIGDGKFRSEFSDMLAPGELSNETMISEEQVVRKKLYDQVFHSANRLAPFPSEPCLLFWTSQFGTAVNTEEDLRRETSTLVVAPLQFLQPEVGQTVCVPPTLLPYYSIPDEDGSIGAVYTNRTRRWLQRPSGGSVVLRFDLPKPCQPFQFESAELQLRIQAGSRKLTVQAGQVGKFTEVSVMQSPVGNFTIDLPVSALNAAGGESVVLKFSIGDVEFEKGDEDSLSASQESYWKIERVLLTVNGQRTNQKDSEDNRSK